MKIALAQIQSEQGKLTQNFSIIEDYLKKEKADIVIFPEMGTTGYLIHDEIYNLAETIPGGPIITRLEELARQYDTTIIAGLPERESPGVLFNTAAVVDSSGFIDGIRKISLPNHSVFDENRYFRSATSTHIINLPKLDLNIGVLICYDVWFPEITRLLTIQGADLLICISASPGMRQEYFEALLKARAIENTQFMVYVNQAGVQDHLSFWGGSTIIDPRGQVLLKLVYDKPDYGTMTLNLETRLQAATFIPTLKDLKPWFYEELDLYGRMF